MCRGTRQRCWLRHYVISRKVAGSIPVEVIGFFNWSNPSSRTMALGSTQPLTEMRTRNLPGSIRWPARKADNLTAIYDLLSWKCWSLDVSKLYVPPRFVTGIALPYMAFLLWAWRDFVLTNRTLKFILIIFEYSVSASKKDTTSPIQI
jgi:hypothetical protein